ncbi:MAG: mechanosensitive ion channel [bacterium]
MLAVIWDVDRRALAFLDGISLYTMGSGAEAVAVTLADVVRVILVGVIIGLVLKWLPGLFDFVFFRYIDVEPGVRYAIVTIARYAFFFIGVLVAFDAVHLDLTKLGWLVAAVGVGLGFGLQEIVANFVSGIILLLERPIRIGDWITIGSIEGAVQTINIRATSILTLDRQEIIVPNKDLITTNVINWTRGDRVVRLKVPIGVAYGSDVDRVRKILLDVAKNDSRVLPAPPPTALLLAHGDSSLDFELRVHYENPAQRFPLLGALNAAINRALAEAGVEIPFPQRDIHIRSGLPDFEALLRPRPETSPRPETRDDDDAGDTRRQPDE